MKKRILIALTFLTGVFLYSCSTSKKTSSDQSKIEKPAIVSAKEVETDVKKVEPVNLPETKEELGFVKSNYEEEEENRGDFYGTKFNEYKNIPIYDINNLPISVWFIKQKNDYKGFIVAGHATKAVCEVASLEVHNKIKAIGKSESTIFSFGVGYNILDNNESSSSYNEIMQGMKEEFEELEGDNEEQVSVNEIDYTKYVEYQMMFKTHIDLAKQSKGWGTHIVEYKLEDFPIIAPFYYIQNSEKIKVTIPKKLFGEIPSELVFASYQKSISEMEDYLNDKIEINSNEISRIKRFKNSDEEIPVWKIKHFAIEGMSVYEKNDILFGYSPPPEGLSYVTQDQFGRIISERPITFKEALTYLNNSEIVRNTSPTLIKQLREWKAKAEEERSSFEQRKKDLINNIEVENKNIRKVLSIIINRKKELLNRDNNDYIIDAFLRGWVFDTGDDKLNNELDNWYSEKRNVVWNYILDNVPNSRINEKMGGVFHSDDVFFQIESEGIHFAITPYKVVGGEFIQIIDKQIGISYIQSPFNFRLTQK